MKTLSYMLMMIASVAALAGCSGQSVAPLSGMEQQTQDTQTDTDLISSIGPLIADQPSLPKEASDWLDDLIIDIPDFEIDWDIVFDSMHTSVAYGENEIPGDAYMGASSNVSPQTMLVGSTVLDLPGPHDIELPIFEDRPFLDSSSSQMAYVTYGLKDIPAGMQIKNVKVEGEAALGTHDYAGVYIGIGNYGSEAYQWFGPFGPDSAEWNLPVWAMDTVNDHQRAYITLAVYGSDELQVNSLTVEIGEQYVIPDFDWEWVEVDDFIGPDDFVDFPEDHLDLPDWLGEMGF